MKATFTQLFEIIKKNRTKTVVTGSMAIVALTLFIIGSLIKGSLNDGLNQVYDSTYNIKSSIDQIKSSIVNEERDMEIKRASLPIEYVGIKVDSNLWRIDDKFMWCDENMISNGYSIDDAKGLLWDAFHFDNGDEYNEMREAYIEKLGWCMFTAVFMSPFDEEAYPANQREAAKEKWSISNASFRSYPIEIDGEGYTYLAVVEIKDTLQKDLYSDIASTRQAIFTYRMIHFEDGSVAVQDLVFHPVSSNSMN